MKMVSFRFKSNILVGSLVKINIVVPSTVLGGGIRVIFQYSNFLVSQGHDVIIYVPMLAYTNKRGIPNLKTSIANTFKRGTRVNWFDCKFQVKLALAIKNPFIRDADLTIASAWFTAPDVSELGPSKGKKVYFIQGYEYWGQKNKEVVYATYQLKMNRIVITNGLKELLKKQFGVESTVIYNGHAQNEYLDGEKIGNKKKCIIMLYTKDNQSNLKGMRQAIQLLKNLYHKYGIRIILFGIRNPCDLPEYFEFYEQPVRESLISLYQQADIYLFPSLQEGWGLPVIEAMANKCAVVGNNTGCLKELCTDGKEALIVDNFDFAELQSKVETLINDEAVLRRIQNNGYKLAKTLKWEESFNKFENYLKSIIEP
jgi:glycosyltransferase involved in cell wall biosynthesis